MKIKLFITCASILCFVLILSGCSDSGKEKEINSMTDFGGFESQIKWGEHLVRIGGCEDCHTPKKMTPKGPVLDESLKLSGHPAGMPPPDVDRKEMESKRLSVTQDLTAWVGPWGISYAANLTPDETGIGLWQESNFLIALREGKYKGMKAGRSLLPPMPWEFFEHMSDDEIKAIFAYLKSVKPIKNIVPQAEPPVTAGQTPPDSSSK
ncbi:MAG: diheme cytochrome c-553 [Ignavibacteria bacterium]